MHLRFEKTQRHDGPKRADLTLQNEGNLKHSFSAEDIAVLAHHMSIQSFDDNAILMRKDEPADCMAFLISGRFNH